ncbi:hypothetical protein R8Z50_15570 [Longispora sp. K20-0274]|uniref:hypothetical protein n=1 Tax=Longispora sp. K20-0274 TaxID=3088255 RepID=UPI00399BA696
MTDTDLIRSWKDPESRDEPAADHPVGEIRPRIDLRAGSRVLALVGMAGVLFASLPGTETTTSLTG